MIRSRLAATVAFLLLCGCGGGGGSSPAPVPTPAPTPTPSPTPPPNPRPATAGDTYSFSGTLTQKISRNGTANTATTNQTVAQQIVVAANATFQGQTGLFDFATVETDTSPLQTIKTTSDVYYGFAPATAGTTFLQFGTSSTDSNGVKSQVVYGPNNRLVDQLPEVTGASWTNSAALTSTETDPSGTTSTLTIADNGTYTYMQSLADGTTASATENADGSASVSLPFLGTGGNTTVNLAAPPTPAPSSSPVPLKIAVSIAYGAPLQALGLPPTQSLSVPVWFPQPLVLASETDVNGGQTALPAACSVGAKFAGSATVLTRTNSRVDTGFGEIDQQTTTSYIKPGYGVVCLQLHDNTLTYYDYSGQSANLLVFSSSVVQQTVTDETLALQSATVAGSQAAQRAGTSGVIRAARARFDLLLAQSAAQRRAGAQLPQRKALQ